MLCFLTEDHGRISQLSLRGTFLRMKIPSRLLAQPLAACFQCLLAAPSAAGPAKIPHLPALRHLGIVELGPRRHLIGILPVAEVLAKALVLLALLLQLLLVMFLLRVLLLLLLLLLLPRMPCLLLLLLLLLLLAWTRHRLTIEGCTTTQGLHTVAKILNNFCM
jgi:hypothetical protein